MDRINHPTAVDIGLGRRGFRSKDTVVGMPGTVVTAGHMNSVQEELMALIEYSNIAPDANYLAQVTEAVRGSRLSYVYGVGGSANALTATLNPPPASLASLIGAQFRIVAALQNTGDVTISFNGLPPVNVVLPGGAPLQGGELRPGLIFTGTYDGNWFALSGLLAMPKPKRVLIFDTPGPAAFNALVGETIFRARAWGGGGAGGGSFGAADAVAKGGGGGGYCEGVYPLTPLQSFAITIGAGGTSPASPGNGTDGGTTSVGAFLTAQGGNGGVLSGGGVQLLGGIGGGAVGGQFNWPGNESQPGANLGGYNLQSVGGPAWGSCYGAANVGAANDGNNAIFPGMGGNGAYGNGQRGGGGQKGLVILETY